MFRREKSFVGLPANRSERSVFRCKRNNFARNEFSIRHHTVDNSWFKRTEMRFTRIFIVGDIRPATRALTSVRTRTVQMSHQTAKRNIHKIVAAFNHTAERTCFFITAAPVYKRRIVAKPFDLIFTFLRRIFQPIFFSIGNIRTSKHKVLPNHNTEPIAGLVKNFVFINAAAPNAKHIVVRIFSLCDKFNVFFFRNRAGKTIKRYPVRAFDENIFIINFNLIAKHFIAKSFLHKLYGTICHISFFGRYNFSIANKFYFVGVQRLFAVAARPPKLRVGIMEGYEMLTPFYHHHFRFYADSSNPKPAGPS